MFFRRTKPACRTVDCPGDDSPIRNYTAEGPDQRLFCRLGTFTDTPKIGQCWERTGCAETACSLESTEQAQLEATQAAAECVWSTWSTPSCPPDPNGIPPTQPPPVEPPREPVNIYRNDAQTCTVYCNDGTPVSYTVPAGRYSNPSKLEANTAAYTEACVEAQKLLNEGECMGCCDQVAEILSILQGSGAGAPVFFGTFPSGDETSVYQGQVLVRGSLPMTFSVVSGSLPDGTSLNTSTGLITGSPIGGNYTFTLKAQNSFGSTTQEFSIAIVGIAPLFTYPSLLYCVVNNANCTEDLVTVIPLSSIQPTGTNVGSYTGTPPITWTVEQGTAIDPPDNFVSGMPDGLSIDPSTGQLTGFPNNDAQLPNTGFGHYGAFSIKVRGTNAWGTHIYPEPTDVIKIQLYVYPSGTPMPPP